MICPRCHNEGLQDYDGKELKHIEGFYRKFIDPISFCYNTIKYTGRVAKTIYYDFTSIKQTDEYFWCPICDHYFIECPHCNLLNDIGNDIMISPKKIHCKKCSQYYVYVTHPDVDKDDEPRSRYL